MTRTHRALNRLALGLVGIALLAVAGVAALPLLSGRIPPVPIDAASTWLRSTSGLIAIVASALALVVIAVSWIATRGRGRARDIVGRGDLAVDDRVVEDLLRDRLAPRSSVLGVHARGYRQRRPVVYARLVVRRSTDLVALLADIDVAGTEVADALGVRPPLVVHLTSGPAARARRARIAR